MRRLIATLTCLSILIVSCAQGPLGSSPTDPGGSLSMGTATVVFSFQNEVTAAAGLNRTTKPSSFTSGTITLVGNGTNFTEALAIDNGTAAAVFAALPSGSATAYVNFYDADGLVTYSGSSAFKVAGNRNVNVAIAVSPAPSTTGSLTITIPLPDASLVLWNTLGSLLEYQNSACGPNLTVNGDRPGLFVPAKYGYGILMNSVETRLIVPEMGLSTSHGTIEFWVAPQFNSTDSAWGYLVYANENMIESVGHIHVAYVGDATGAFLIQVGWRRNVITPCGFKAGEKHHFAVTWDREGFGIGAEYLRAFWDGTNIGGTTIDKRADVAAIPNISVGRNIVAMYNGIRPANMMFDNLKIYSTWKTNFSDRTVE